MNRKLLLLLVFMLAGIGLITAQNHHISGVVISEDDGLPILGASVIIKGTSIGTVTDNDGKFVFSNVPADAKSIVISYIGMQKQELAIKPTLTVTLKSDVQQIDEIVVTAMGMKKERKALGYAAQDLKAEDLNTDGTTSLANAIQGKLTGVEIHQSSGMPGASAQIIIRGARSFDGNNQPLYVIDGMPISTEADFTTGYSVTGANIADRSIDINPEDIESINVLKGQAASALYGIRASNGVIVITTKRGSKYSQKPQISLSTNISAERVSRKFKRQTIYAQGNSISQYNPGSSMSWGPKITDLPDDPIYGGNSQGHPGQYYNPKREEAGLDGWTTPQIYDNVGDLLGTGLTENTNLSISQSKDKVAYSFSLSNSHQDGIIPSTGMNRWTARAAVDWQLNDEFKTGVSANYSSSDITSAPGANSGIVNIAYSAPAEYDLKGIPYCSPDDPSKQIVFRNLIFDNPYWWAVNNKYGQQTDRAFGNAYLEYRPKIGWGENYNLVFREQAGIDIYTSNYTDIHEVGSAELESGYIQNYGAQDNIFNNLFTATWTGKWDKFGVDIILGNEVNQARYRYWSYYGSNFNFYGLPTISNTTSLTAYEYISKERTVGTFGSLSASWDDQLYLTVTGRNDIVSTMPRGNRSFFYPSVSLGWIFTELHNLKGKDLLSYGKLRLSYAQVGQAGNYHKNYMTTHTYSGGFYSYYPITYPINGISAYTPSYVLFDDNLKPQNTSNIEAGIDLNFFKNRLRLEYTYSYQNIKDQIFDVPIDVTSGYEYMRTNAGRMQTNSHELSVNLAILDSKDYSLDFGANFTKVVNKVVELAEGVESIFLGGFESDQIRAQAGDTYPIIYGSGFKRDEATGLLILDDNGLPQGTNTSVKIGSCSPNFNMGFNLNARYKNLSLTSTWSWQNGGKMYHGTNATMNLFGVTKESIPYHEGNIEVTGILESTGEKVTMEVNGQDYYMAYYNIDEAAIYSTDFVKLRDLTLSYQLPRIKNLNISIFGFARNVLIWAKLPNFDPESSQGNTNMSGYFERFSVPATSSYGGGLKLTF
jgi:TonB-linked SusC/RagA family outer membrane protein